METVSVTDGDGSQMLRGRTGTEIGKLVSRGRMGMDTVYAVTDGYGLIFHYCVAL